MNTSVSSPLYAAGNFGADTDPDLVTGENGGVKVRSGNGNGTFTGAVAFVPGSNPSVVTLGDLSGDGKLDAVIANIFGTSVSVMFGLGGGEFGRPVDYPVGESPQAVTLGDFNNDNLLDILTANTPINNASLCSGNPAARSRPRRRWHSGCSSRRREGSPWGT